MVFMVYIKVYSSDTIYDFLDQTVSYTLEQCQEIFSDPETGDTFFEPGLYACGPVSGNNSGSYLTMLSSGGLMFGIINIIGNFGTVFVDQSYWQSAIAARPQCCSWLPARRNLLVLYSFLSRDVSWFGVYGSDAPDHFR